MPLLLNFSAPAGASCWRARRVLSFWLFGFVRRGRSYFGCGDSLYSMLYCVLRVLLYHHQPQHRYAGSLLDLSAPPAQLDGSAVNASTAAAVQGRFMAAIRLADELYDTTADEKASIAMLRAALTGCPGCPLTHPGQAGALQTALCTTQAACLPQRAYRAAYVCGTGRWSQPVFNVDHFDDRLMLYGQILPQVYHQNVKDVLWVGVQPYTLRYEYLFAKQGIRMTSLEVRLCTHACHTSFCLASLLSSVAASARSIAWSWTRPPVQACTPEMRKLACLLARHHMALRQSSRGTRLLMCCTG